MLLRRLLNTIPLVAAVALTAAYTTACCCCCPPTSSGTGTGAILRATALEVAPPIMVRADVAQAN